ncbi:MAG: HAD family hydrolase [Candidatus Zhuqueibacterota bacterium]
MIKIVIFDLGRVLIDVDVDRCLNRFADEFHVSVPEILGNNDNRAHADFMVGKIDEEEFHRLTCQRFSQQVELETLRAMWLTMLGQPKRDTIAVLAALVAQNMPVALLSNVDPWHYQHCEEVIPEIRRIEKKYLSYLIKLKKPDLEIFNYVAADLKIPAEQCLFVDDLLENVEAANKIGMATVHFRESEQLIHELQQHGIRV